MAISSPKPHFERQSRAPYVGTDASLCKADFWWPNERLVVEIQGGTWTGKGTKRGGWHQEPKRYARDCRKLNAAARNGYYTLFFTTEMVNKGNIARDTTLAVLERLRSESTRRACSQEIGTLSSPEVAYRPVVAA